MSRLWSITLIGVIAMAVAGQRPLKHALPTTAIMIAAVVRDGTVLVGGISSPELAPEGKVYVEPLGRLTPSGGWSGLPCSSHTLDMADGPKKCVAFGHRYLSKPHDYTVVSAGGYGTVVHAASTGLDECYGYTGTGTYRGMAFRKFAIAASSATPFAKMAPPRPLGHTESVAVYKALKALVPKRLVKTKKLQLFGVNLEGHTLIVVERTFADVVNTPAEEDNLIFGIGTLDGSGFHILYWKQYDNDQQHTMLGTIALKNGRQFLVTTVNGPEGQWFRVYGIRAGHLALVYTGGGSSC